MVVLPNFACFVKEKWCIISICNVSRRQVKFRFAKQKGFQDTKSRWRICPWQTVSNAKFPLFHEREIMHYFFRFVTFRGDKWNFVLRNKKVFMKRNRGKEFALDKLLLHQTSFG
jgi:hypothetical protein